MKMPFSSLSRETRIGLVVLLVLLLLFARNQIVVIPVADRRRPPCCRRRFDRTTRLCASARFRTTTARDSLRYVQARQAQWDEWQREKEERRLARERREEEYQANRARWDAEKPNAPHDVPSGRRATTAYAVRARKSSHKACTSTPIVPTRPISDASPA